MKTSTCWQSLLQASASALLFSTVFAQTATVELGPITTLGCYQDAGTLIKDNTNTFQTSGICAPACGNKGYAVMAIIGGSTCYCGNELPALDQEVDDSKCNSPCQGFDTQTCGGIGFYQLYLTGLSGDVETLPNSTSSSSTSARPTHPAETVVVTASASSKPSQEAESGPNKVGIAVGVVVGVIAIAACAGGAIFYMKQKRRREIEEEHKAQANVASFIGSTKSDSRLDPSVASSYRRESIGSIADERDFSRKILQVRNPDRGSMTSVA